MKFSEVPTIKKYRPSNGTEGMIFQDKFCDKCTKFRKGSCSIFNRSFFNDINDKAYPKEWVYDSNGNPTCTSFTNEPIKRKKVYNGNDGSLFEMKPE